MSNFEYIPFRSIDFKGENSLSSYALKETPLTFIPDLTNVKAPRVLWSFGDGSTSTALTATKHYDVSGEYVVNLVVYDCFSKASISTESKRYNIKNYFDETFTVSLSDNIWKNGKINGPLIINTFHPPNTSGSDIFYTVDGSNSINYFEVKREKFSHLQPTYQFFDKFYNNNIKSEQFRPIYKISFPKYDTIYGKISSGSIVICNVNDADSFTLGLSATKEIYFKDDTISDNIQIDLFFDRKDNIFNNLTVALTAKIIENDEVDRLSITSNGLDGEFFTISSFNIDSIKFSNCWIPFIVKIKDLENFTVKNFPMSGVGVDILSANAPLDPSFYSISSFDIKDGYYYGGVRFTLPNVDSVLSNLKISSNGTLTNYKNTTYALSGESEIFKVFGKNYIKLEKVNENFDMTETIKSLRFQEFLLNNKNLFDEFIRSIFGDINSSPDSLGKTLHEKISNFFENHYDIDRCGVTALISLIDMLGVDVNAYDSSLLKYPEAIKRVINLSSIQNSKLFGSENKFAENFNPRGRASKDEFGKNLGEQIDTKTYTLTAGIPIVSYEKFSKEYTIQQPITFGTYIESLSTMFTYPLSSYNESWGWSLVLPDNFAFDDIEKFYNFYEYAPGFSGEIVGNTVTNEEDSYFDNKIRDVLYHSLGLNNL